MIIVEKPPRNSAGLNLQEERNGCKGLEKVGIGKG
jgi:hypothetical protein